MNRRVLSALVLLGLSGCAPTERPGEPPDHALLITISGLRADHVAIWMYPRPTTSTAAFLSFNDRDLSIDGLTQSGVGFAHAFATSADSAASLASLHTGVLAPGSDARTLAQCFAEAGFKTAAFVTGVAAADPDLTRGFDLVVRPGGEGGDAEAAAQILSWFEEVDASSGERLFVWLHLSGPASLWEAGSAAPEKLSSLFLDPGYAGAMDGSAESMVGLRAGPDHLDGQDMAAMVALYDAEIASTNFWVGRVTDTLAGSLDTLPHDLLSRTVLVLAGDSGVELFQHDRSLRSPDSLFDASLHVPLVLRHPASLTGRRFLSELVDLRDVPSTLIDWFGLPSLDGEGRSLLALTDSHVQREFEGRPMVLRRPDGGSVREERWHLIVRSGQSLLFDTQADPLERRDRIADFPDVAARLARHLIGNG